MCINELWVEASDVGITYTGNSELWRKGPKRFYIIQSKSIVNISFKKQEQSPDFKWGIRLSIITQIQNAYSVIFTENPGFLNSSWNVPQHHSLPCCLADIHNYSRPDLCTHIVSVIFRGKLLHILRFLQFTSRPFNSYSPGLISVLLQHKGNPPPTTL